LEADGVKFYASMPRKSWHSSRNFSPGANARDLGKYIDSVKDFSPRAKAASFTITDVMEKISIETTGKN
jgi:hypothetical protein